ncbi:hypothetical protein GPECTOR_48g424 [Gonium pectorale]|uniref:SRCR domain-containing protein n=1 Tax=Gonium pectorale TaxID=33097 RepID=A0A150G826_GONPE|nr:hypothetical protein GPECTOR_48g424 [Gonium pectorale]|eukprot:KXZ45992.1 hypothetical protein GPECTOR_48g424 [Gonium pectorale]
MSHSWQLGWSSGELILGTALNGSTSLVTFDLRLGCRTGLWNSSSVRLLDCLTEPIQGYANWGDGHASDFGVTCFNETNGVRQGAIRLVPDPESGLQGTGALQLWYNGMWGYLQIENWNWAGALAACRELGYNSGSPLMGAVVGAATGPTWYGYVACTGTEAKLWDCIVASLENYVWEMRMILDPTDHTYDTGVRCYNDTLPPIGTLRLGRGQRPNEGHLEIFLDTWTVLAVSPYEPAARHYFTQRDALVACRELGYPTGRFITRLPMVGLGPPLWMPKASVWTPASNWVAGFGCTGNETSLIQCGNVVTQNLRSRLRTPPDPRYAPVTVRCSNTTEAPDGSIRLMGGSTRASGRVEVMQNGQWGGFCQDSFSWRVARVVCRQLGYTTGKPVYGLTYGMPGSLRLVGGPVAWIGRLEIFYEGAWGTICRSSQATNLRVPFGIKQARVACRQLGYRGGRVYGTQLTGSGQLYQPDRQPSWLRDIDCSGTVSGVPEPATGAVRLVGGPNTWSGRVEVYYDGMWGTIGRITTNEARVICAQLGITGGRPGDAKYTYGTGSGPVWLSGFTCQGSETNITQCSNVVWNGEAASHEYDATVMCYPPTGGIVAEYTLAAGAQDPGMLGTWQEWRFCPYSSFMAGAHVQAQYGNYYYPDVTGVTSVALYCFQDGVFSTALIPPIKGSSNQQGDYWLGPYACSPTPGNASKPWHFVGARLRVLNNQGAGDDAGVTGVEFLCR